MLHLSKDYNMIQPLKVLILEDSTDDAELMVRHLRQSGFAPDWHRVDSEPAYLAHLNPALDLILADHSMPLFDSARALQRLQERGLDIPFIIVSGIIGEDAAVSALKRGAADYLLKDRLARLGEAVKHALEQKQLRDEKQRAEAALNRYAVRLEILHQIDLHMIEAKSIQALVDSVLKPLRRLIPCQSISVEIIDAETRERLVFALDFSDGSVLDQGLGIPISTEFFGGDDARHIHISGDLRLMQESSSRAKQLTSEGIVSALNVPLMDQEYLLGTLELLSDMPSFFTTEYQEIAAEVANQLAIAIHQMQLTQEIERHRALLEQRIAERTTELQAAKDRAEAILDNSADGILLISSDLQIQQTNAAFNRLFGCDTDAYFHQPLTAFIHRDDIALVTNTIQANGLERTIEIRAYRKDGTVFDAELSIGSVKGDGLVCTIRDITERKKVEGDLRESEEKFRLLMEGAPQAIVISDERGIITVVNAQAEKAFGYSREELIGQASEVLVPKEVRTQHQQYRADYGTTPHARPVGGIPAVPVRRKDGTHFSAEIGLSYVETNTGLMVMSFVADITEREQNAAALEEQRTFLRKVIDVSPSLIFVKDYDARFVLVNPLVAQMYNTTVEALIGKSDADFNPSKEEVEHFLQADRQVIASGVPQVFEEPITSFKGETHWLETTKVPIVSADGKSKYVLGVANDITQRRVAEQALNTKIAQEREFQIYLKELHEITIELAQIDQLDDFYRQVVELGLKRLGFERMGLFLYDIEHGMANGTYGTDEHGQVVAEHHLRFEPAGPIRVLMDAMERTERFAFFDQVPLYSNLEPVSFGWNAAAVLWNGEQTLGWIAVDNGILHKPASKPLLDILSLYALTVGTLLGRKRIEADLAQSEASLRSVMNSTSVGIILIDQDGVMHLANQLAHDYILRLYQLPLEMGKTRLFDLELSNRADVESLFQKVFAGERINVELVRMVDIQQYVLDLRYDPVTTSDGTVIGATISFVDITERKQAEEALRQAFEKEKELSELKSRFTSMVTHEFRTPLAILMSSTDLLMVHGNRMDEAKKQERFAKIQQQVSRMIDLLDETLAITKAETVGLEFNPQLLNLRDFCVSLVNEFQSASSTHRIEFRSRGEVFDGLFDPKLMHQAITNLLSNAVKYSPQSDYVILELVSQDSEVTITVQDYGLGILEEDQKHLFEPFHRGKNVGSITGTGLGLPIVQRAVEAQGGTIHVVSELDVGTIFTIRLPLSH